VFTACAERSSGPDDSLTRTNWGPATVSDGRDQPTATSSSSVPLSNPDSNVSDTDLLLRLRTELSTVQQDPTAYPSAWAAGLGVPQDIRFGPATPNQGGRPGGYRVSPAGLRDWISELQVILDWANERDRFIRVIQESRPAAPDGGSGTANGAYVNTGRALQRSNDAIRAYAAKLITVFTASLQAYENTEQSNQDTLRGVGKGGH
jgi:hypothetical protein